jgi:hypothetical protein
VPRRAAAQVPRGGPKPFKGPSARPRRVITRASSRAPGSGEALLPRGAAFCDWDNDGDVDVFVRR